MNSFFYEGKKYYVAYSGEETTNFKTISRRDSIKIEDILTEEEGIRVHIDCETNKLTFEEHSFDFDCQDCKKFEGIYFKNDKASQYVDFAVNNAIRVDKKLAENEELVTQLVSKVKNYEFPEVALGQRLTDRIKAYEKFNGKRFLIVFAESNHLSLNESSWGTLSQKVFAEAGLTDDDILITVPYVHCEGIGRDLGEIFVMPGYSAGKNIKNNSSFIGSSYKNTIRTAEWMVEVSDPEAGVLSGYFNGVFKSLYKRLLVHKGILNADFTITYLLYEGYSYGKLQNAYVDLYMDSSFKTVTADWLATQENRRLNNLNTNFVGPVKAQVDYLVLNGFLTRTINTLSTPSQLVKFEESDQFKDDRFEFKDEFLVGDFDALNQYFTELSGRNIVKPYILNRAYKGYVERLAKVNNVHFNEFPFDLKEETWNREQVLKEKVDDSFYLALDIASIALSYYGQDHWADGLGLIYSILRGNWVEAGDYTVAVFIPVADGQKIKLSRKAILKVDFDSKIVREVTADQASKIRHHISETIPDGKAKAVISRIDQNQIDTPQLQKLKSLEANPEAQLKYIDDILASAGESLLAKFEKSPYNISRSQIEQLKRNGYPSEQELSSVFTKFDHYLKASEGKSGALALISETPPAKVEDFLKQLNALDQAEAGLSLKFLGDCAENVDFVKYLGNRPELVDSWRLLDDAGYAALKKNPVSLEKLSALLKNPKLAAAGLDENRVSRLIKGNRNAGGSAAALDDLTKGFDDLVSTGTIFEDIDKLFTDLEKGGNFAEGAGWIQRHLTSNVDDFAGKTLIFESVEKVGESVRRVDVKMPDGNITKYFEFKSVGEIPPSNFATQFVKDMQISDVSDLGQLKWIFDGRKVPSLQNNIDDFIDALDEVDIPQSVIDKLVPGASKTKDALLETIESRFTEIFQVK
ncbi:hypothetical protein [Persicobacter diffluens]|uniref:Uncharacterized protein n=1 Tax=Persicobacter diffluens TaxID=981 RepID=A0AAN4W0D1_9BACT|nr:hypothetical protein PEDI_36200 [Persicobacter diffluens]